MSRYRREFWTQEEIDRAKGWGEKISRYLRENSVPCRSGCLCSICGGDPAKQQPADGAPEDQPKVRTHKSPEEKQ